MIKSFLFSSCTDRAFDFILYEAKDIIIRGEHQTLCVVCISSREPQRMINGYNYTTLSFHTFGLVPNQQLLTMKLFSSEMIHRRCSPAIRCLLLLTAVGNTAGTKILFLQFNLYPDILALLLDL